MGLYIFDITEYEMRSSYIIQCGLTTQDGSYQRRLPSEFRQHGRIVRSCSPGFTFLNSSLLSLWTWLCGGDCCEDERGKHSGWRLVFSAGAEWTQLQPQSAVVTGPDQRSRKELLSLRESWRAQGLFLVLNLSFQVWHFNEEVFMISCPAWYFRKITAINLPSECADCNLSGWLWEQLNGRPSCCKAPGSWWHERCRSRSFLWRSTASWKKNIIFALLSGI